MPGPNGTFIPALAAIALMVGFHALIVWRLLRIVVGKDRTARRRLLGVAVALIALIDLPVAHAFLVYKYFNPEILDDLMSSLSTVLIIAHVNVAVVGVALMIRDFIVRPLRLRSLRRRRGARTGERLRQFAERIPETRLTAPARAGIEHLAARPNLVPRRMFLRTGALAAAGFAASATSLSAMSDEERIERVKIKVPGLPEKLRGTTIAMITDIHSSVYMSREQMEKYRAQLNAMKADVIVVTGDFINSKLREVYPFAEAFSGLSAPLGVYGVTGNHDYYPREIETVVREVEQAGIRVLRNENLALEKNGERFWLMGMDDAHIYEVKEYIADGRTTTGRIDNLVAGIPNDSTRIFLCHKPYPFEEYTQLGVDLMLSGHTHGGQVVIAQLDNVNLSFASLASRYVSGLYRSRSNPRSQMYVSRGVGTVGIPIRVNCPPEVTHIVLV